MNLKKPKLLSLIVVAIAMSAFGISYLSGLKINMTDSMPRGLYFLYPAKVFHRNDLVAVKLPSSQILLGINRRYIKSEDTLLFKRIIAIPGDSVTLKDNEIIINGKEISAITFIDDGQNRKMNPVRRGNYLSKGYWVLGENQNSWDSRYFGELPEESLVDKVAPVLII